MIYHSSPYKFDKFRPLSHFGTLQAALHRVSAYIEQDNHYMYICDVDLGRCRVIEDYGNETEFFHCDMYQQGLISKSEYKYLCTIDNHLTRMEMLSEILNHNGIDSLKYINCEEDKGSWSFIITNSDQVSIRAIEKI